MTAFVLDASVALKFVVPEIHSAAALDLVSAGHQFIAPDLLLAEVGSALGRRVGRGEITALVADAAIDTVARAAIEWQPLRPLVSEALRLANALRQSIYDCVYLALAMRRGSCVVTADRKFYDAVRRGPNSSLIVWIEDAVRAV